MRSLFCALLAGLVPLSVLCTGAFADDVSYTYDAMGRLVRVDYASGPTVVYNYDPAGNRTSVAYGCKNGAPVANSDTAATTIRNPVTFDPRANDTDPNGDPLTISAVGQPSHGSVTNNAKQTLTYTPSPTFPPGVSGTDTFTYQISDPYQHTATGTITVTVTDAPPIAVPDSAGVPYGAPTKIYPLNNDSDPDGDSLKISSTGSPKAPVNGAVNVDPSGQFMTYTPNAGFSGVDTFSYTITDGHTNTATALETMNVAKQNQPPVAVNDQGYYAKTTTPHNPVTPWFSLNPLLNDTDPDNDSLTVIAVTQPVSGKAGVSFTGNSVAYTYGTSVQNLEMTDSFTYTISDGQGHTATATVSVYLSVETDGS